MNTITDRSKKYPVDIILFLHFKSLSICKSALKKYTFTDYRAMKYAMVLKSSF